MWFQSHACSDGDHLKQMESLGIPVVVGEWSLATVDAANIFTIIFKRIIARCG